MSIVIVIEQPGQSLLMGRRVGQVELNTIASSFGALSAVVTALHRYTLGRSDNTHNKIVSLRGGLHYITSA